MAFTTQFIEEMRQSLDHRRASKERILQSGGEQALSHSYKDIRRIDYALKRITEGQYGLCTQCGQPIKTDRLSLIPETPFCTDCAKSVGSH